MIARRPSRELSLGKVRVGGGAPLSVQSMTNTDTRDAAATLSQARRLEDAGCEILRVGVPDREAAEALAEIKKGLGVPLVADIHFDHRLALLALDAGVDGLRINPGNIGGEARVRELVAAAKERGTPIRIGVNAGSLEKSLLKKYGGPSAEAMVESALRHVGMLEREGFHEIKVSLKASDPWRTVEANRLFAKRTDYPIHLGVTEAGSLLSGSVRSAVALAILLSEGIGDTIRVSLSADPLEEVRAGFEILRALGLREKGVTVIACPTCSRSHFDVTALAEEIERTLLPVKVPLRVALMGCEVNGPGEAAEADVGISGGKGFAMLYVGGKKAGKVRLERAKEALLEAVGEEIARKES